MLRVPTGESGLGYECHMVGIRETDTGIAVSCRIRPSVYEEDRTFKYHPG